MKMNFDEIIRAGAFSDLDRRFARFVVGEDGEAGAVAGVAAALVSYQLRRGQIFLDLVRAPVWDDSEGSPLGEWPTLEVWQEELSRSPAVGGPGASRPLVLSGGGKLYLQRYWFYEKLLAGKLREFAGEGEQALEEEMKARLDELFANAPDQKEAARKALVRSFSLISGGPGTGKTTTVLKILMLLLEREPGLTIRLAAPTGKAAAKLQESIRAGLSRIECPEAIRERVEEQQASTVHRLLGPIPESVFFRHHEENPLAADVVVLDEASMIDLPLMAKLFAALPLGCRVIMLGDKDQLASVEAGSVLSGIVEAAVDAGGGRKARLSGVATLLKQNFRFGNESAIFRVCNAVREGDFVVAEAICRSDSEEDRAVGLRELPTVGELKERLRGLVVDRWRVFLKKKDPEAALEAFGRFQILTALRQGPYGKENLNGLVEEILREEGLIQPGRRHFPGRPLMVTENDYALRLFNGDIGVLLEDEGCQLMAYFRNDDGTIRKISPLRLPFVEPAFAMTVHKSQGSEFDEVLVVLPPHDTRVLTRELIYTAISRARIRVEIWSDEEILRSAIGRNVSRGSGLVEMLG